MRYTQGSIIITKAAFLKDMLTPRRMKHAPMAEMVNGRKENIPAKKVNAYGLKRKPTAKNRSSANIAPAQTFHGDGKANLLAQSFREFIATHSSTVNTRTRRRAIPHLVTRTRKRPNDFVKCRCKLKTPVLAILLVLLVISGVRH